MIKKFSILFLLAISFSCFSQTQDAPLDVSQCAEQAPYGQPTGAKQDTTIICRKAYILEHNNKAKVPDWVSYVLIPAHAVGCVPRSNAFAPDRSLPEGSRSELKDYAKSGYDIGHQANDGDMSWDVDVERESFILSNMAPQLPGFNRGIWKKLEDQTRAWAVSRNDTLLVYVGPIYSLTQDNAIGKDRVIVPHAFFKIIVDIKTNEVMAFEFKHESSSKELDTFMTSLAQVQKDTGLVFPMPKDAVFSPNLWPSMTKSVRTSKKGVCQIR